MRSRILLSVAFTLALVAAAPESMAQSPAGFTVLASGLNAPRGLAFGPDGSLYVAEAGTGGTAPAASLACQQVPPPVGPYFGGSTGTIKKITRSGKVSVVASGFASTVDSVGDLMGVADVKFLEGELYALITGGGCSHGNPNLHNGIAKVDPTTGKWSLISDLSAFAMSHPGQYDNALDFEPDGSWYSLLPTHGVLLAIEPNRGIIAVVTPKGQAEELIDISASQGHIIPTSMAEHNGDIYVGNLLYFPILPDWSQILRLSPVSYISDNQIPGMEHKNLYYVSDAKAGLTTVTAVNFGPDGLLYALELADVPQSPPSYPAPGFGKVLRLLPSGAWEEVITGLNVPTAMAWGPDGRLYISDWGAAGAGLGRILSFQVPY